MLHGVSYMKKSGQPSVRTFRMRVGRFTAQQNLNLAKANTLHNFLGTPHRGNGKFVHYSY